MILSKEQINRYLRHIIIPEISGPGQKKLTESKVSVYAEGVDEVSSLIYYLAASGIGTISCSLQDNTGFEKLKCNVNDLNSDVRIGYIEELKLQEGYDIQLILYKPGGRSTDLINCFRADIALDNTTIIAVVSNGWRGIIKSFKNNKKLIDFLSKLEDLNENACSDYYGSLVSSCFIGAITSVECIKACLGLGTPLNEGIYIDLLSMIFKTQSELEEDIYSFLKEDPDLYRVLEKPEIAEKLQKSKVLIVGTGGLGSPAAYALSLAGVGTIGLVDYDCVEISNLNRQILHSVSRIGMPKGESAREFIKGLNPKVNVVVYNTALNAENAGKLVRDYDVVIDAVDNFPARYLLNDACYFEKKLLVDAAAVKFNGLILTIMPGESACYRCIFPNIPEAAAGQNCRESGVLGPVPGVMGFLQAAEAIKLLSGIGEPLCNRIIYYDALDTEFINIKTGKSAECELCGKDPRINILTEYQNSCQRK